jgi:hypothetical protein
MACIRGEGEEQVMSAKQHPFLVEVATLLNAAVLAFAVGTAGSASAALQDGHGGNIQFDPQTNEYVLKDKGRVAAVEAERSLATAICAKCHEGAIASLKDSVHFSNQGPNPRILFPGGGAHGALDRACGLPGTSALINYNSDINLGECSKCHVGRFLPPMQNAFTSQFMQMGLPDPAGQAQAIVDGGLDCLICHAEKYLAVRDDLSPEQLDTLQIANYAESGTPSPSPEGYARLARDNTDFDHDGWPDALIDSDGDGVPDMPLMVPAGTDADGNPIYQPWPTVAQDRSVEAVLSVGKTEEHNCLRCHEHARTGYKRATLFLDGYDVHAAATSGPFDGARNRCTVCHLVLDNNHKFVRGHLVGGDLAAADYPPPPPGVAADPDDPTHLTCVQCHALSDLSRRGGNQVHSEGHLEKIACQTCHIPYSGGITYSLYGHGSHVSFGRNAAGLDTKLITRDHMVADDRADVDADYAAYRIPSVLMWFDGMTSFLAQSLSVRDAPNSMITPFKPMANGMVMDGRFFDGEMLTNQAGIPYNAHSMYRFYAGAADCDELQLPGVPPFKCGSDGLYGNAEVFTALGLLGTVKDAAGNVIVQGLTPEQTRKVALSDLMAMGQPSLQAMAMMQAFPNLMNFSKTAYGYEHYLISSAFAGALEDGNSDGVIDANTDALFDMLGAVNTGLMEFKGFNQPMMLPASYDWYPPFTEVDNVATMKLPDGSFMKLFLEMQLGAAGVPPEMIRQLVGNYPAFSNGVTLGGHGVMPDPGRNALGGGKGRNGCQDCHGADGVLANPVPVTRKELVDLGPLGQGEMPVWRWVYYNVKGLIDLGVTTSNEDVLAGKARIDVGGNRTYVRSGKNQMVLNWFNPQGRLTLNGKNLKGYTTFQSADSGRSLKGTGLKAKDLTWNGGKWMPVMEPVTLAQPNYAILGYSRDEVIFETQGPGGPGGGGGGK